ncbi:hypothetical protein [Sphingomonas sp.]|jgi:hypothetical protein|uniref:hypothetical protein n=1 Tax=Sphingomonas sp. TaxID=28214 RepID=UPI002D8048BA|nr:hypothetical protein [Sphingomonas sp.]HEU0044469.1 hypothetical protein [Sphingomonas sp.]
MASLVLPSAKLFEESVARWWRPALLIASLVLGTLARLTHGDGMPLWFDETFTGVIAGQPSGAGLWHWLRTELTGPFFYGTYWLWARVAGVSTEALRLPGMIFTLAAPLIVLRWGHRDATMRLLWATVLLLWLPMAVFAQDARPYALLILLGTLQAAGFCSLMREPTRAAALRWVLPTLAIGLTHYFALVSGLVQGLVLLAVHRRAAARLWPAALPFALLVGWMALHLSFVTRIAGGGMAMSTSMAISDLSRLPVLIVGDGPFALLLALPLGWMLVERARDWRDAPAWRPSPEAWTGLSGVAAFLLLFAVACVVPGIAMRYFLPTLPAAIFGLAWCLRGGVVRGSVAVPAFFLAANIACLGLAASGVGDRSLDQRHAFGMDLPSRWLMERPPERLIFFWADPTAVLSTGLDANVAEVGGFFLHRAGSKAPVELARVPVGADAAALVGARALAKPDTAILWVGNAPSADPRRRPAPLFRDPRWECRDFGAGLALSVACRPRPASPTPATGPMRTSLDTLGVPGDGARTKGMTGT